MAASGGVPMKVDLDGKRQTILHLKNPNLTDINASDILEKFDDLLLSVRVIARFGLVSLSRRISRSGLLWAGQGIGTNWL